MDQNGNWLFDGNLNLYEASEMDRDRFMAGLLAMYHEVDEAYEKYYKDYYTDEDIVKINEKLEMKFGDLKMIFEDNGLVQYLAKESRTGAGRYLLIDGFLSYDEARDIQDNHLDVSDPIVHWNVRYILNDWTAIDRLSNDILFRLSSVGEERRKYAKSSDFFLGLDGDRWSIMCEVGTEYHGFENYKWVSRGGREIVVSPRGELITNTANFGTFNFDNRFVTGKHKPLDMNPYYIFGSTPREFLEKTRR